MTLRSKSAIHHYDRTTIVFHWLTVALVIALFALAEVWDFFPRGSVLRKGSMSLHVSLGILLAAVVVARIIWRVFAGRRLPPATTGLQQRAAKTMHYGLYVLLVVQVALGFVFRWAQGEPFTFFRLFPIPSPFSADRALAHTVGEAHDVVAWTIIVLAVLHASVALVHHYVWRDGVLARMWPRLRTH